MLLGFADFAGMATGALLVIEAIRQSLARYFAIVLGMRIMAVDAGHGTLEIAGAIEMVFLIGKKTYTAIG